MTTTLRPGEESRSLPPVAPVSGGVALHPSESLLSLAIPIEDRLAELLASDQFTVASYLNLALQDCGDDDGGVDAQQRLAELALQLQLKTQACHEEIGQIGAELQAILPRCSADIGRVGVGLEGLRMDAVALLDSTRADTDDQDVSSSLETLSTLHALQANLQRSKEILTAAATWDATLESVSALLAQQNLTEAVNALAQLQSGERALRGMPNPEEREHAIARVRQQVSDLLQPQLKHALASMATRLAPLQQCVALYSKLEKTDTLIEEYVKNRPAQAHKTWFEYKLAYNEEGHVAADQFLQWLPGWFDNVLSLLTEERRQSMTIFGPRLVTTVVVKVFRECFRPLLASFQSRLESIHPTTTKGRVTTVKGSLEAISDAYESTLHFLSLTYESIISGWVDLTESGLVSGENGIELYQELVGIFMQVMSPFSSYQKNLSSLEADYLAAQTRLLARDIQHAARSVSVADLESQQSAIARLEELSIAVFPVCERAIARFELLVGGYGPANALAVVDRTLSAHAGEMAMAIRTLSAAMVADEKELADSFDEPHVLCALEVLKVAGTFRRSLNTLEAKAKERLTLLSQRMEAYNAKETSFNDAMSRRGATFARNPPFSLPDAMSAVEIDSLITKNVCDSGVDEGLNSSLAVLNRLTTLDAGLCLFVETDESSRRLSNSCHVFVYDVCSSVPRLRLANMPSMKAWQEVVDADGIASYGTLPQQYVTHVGEHMLALVQALEPFASDKGSLSVANEVMHDVRDIAITSWREFVEATGAHDEGILAKELMEGKNLLGKVGGSLPPLEDENEGEEERDEGTKASAAFCDAWLDVVGLAVTGRLLERIMTIPSLSSRGCDHLNADINYLVNVFSALGIAGHPHPLLGHVAELVLMDANDLENQISHRDKSDPVQSFLVTLETQMAKLRGIASFS